MPLNTYQSLFSRYSSEYDDLNNKLRWLSFARLLLFVGAILSGYFYFTGQPVYWIIIAICSMGLFLYCIRLYDVIKDKADFAKALLEINKNEEAFIKGQPYAYAHGKEYIDPHHPYSYDLDIFGEGSLYGFLNRTTITFGAEKLARALLHPDTSVIKERQQGINELAGKIDFRQHIQAFGSIRTAEQKDLDKLRRWLGYAPAFPNPILYYFLWIFPLATISVLILYFFSANDQLLNSFFFLFTLNLFILSFFAGKIMEQLSISTAVTKVLQQFGRQLKEIESETFQSPGLLTLQNRIKHNNVKASHSIDRLASLFKYLDFIINLALSPLLNGFFLFHIHNLYFLDKWKKKNGDKVMDWLNVIGEFESLHCFANLAFNNKEFCYPAISNEEGIVASSMGHPLISKAKNVSNDISFQREKFIVLTGSNMSGKSTFLRTMGINLVLARAGSVVCAKSFSLFPYELHVSMRITDSLQDSESFFYAELKRLQTIIRHLETNKKTFVILDEILRGTNSNDKHSGTIGLIRKLAEHKACGIIATHDLTVADLSAEYPGYMANKCFESEIINDELIFDYKLKEGVCTKLNASFLMRKMGVIE
jgi:hypothetical protein